MESHRQGRIVEELRDGLTTFLVILTEFVVNKENTPALPSFFKCYVNRRDEKMETADKNGLHLVDILFHGGRNTRQRS